jgi:hypothetical protein
MPGIPPKQNAAFAAAMEDVPEVYHQPYLIMKINR